MIPIGPSIQPLQWPEEKPFEPNVVRPGSLGFSPYDSISSASTVSQAPQLETLNSEATPVLSDADLKQLSETNQLLQKVSKDEYALANTDFEILKLLCSSLENLKESQGEKGRQATNRILKEKEIVRERWQDAHNALESSKSSKWWVRFFNWLTFGSLTVSGALTAAVTVSAYAAGQPWLPVLIHCAHQYLAAVLALSQAASTAGRTYFSDQAQKQEKKLMQAEHDRTIAKSSIDAKMTAIKRAQEAITALVQKQSEAQQQFWQTMQQNNRE